MDVVSYKCPNCSAPLSYQMDSQSWNCQYCSSVYTLAQLEAALAQPGTQQTQPAAGVSSQTEGTQQETYGNDVKSFSCPSCGGTTITDSATTAAFCSFCHSPTVVAGRAENERRPSKVIPFKLEKNAALAAMRKALKNKPLLPTEFKKMLKDGEITGLYVPYWLYGCEVEVKMQGQGQNISTWTDSSYSYTKTDAYAVERTGTIKFANVPATGSSKIKEKFMQKIGPYDYNELVDFSPAYLSGHFAENSSIDAKKASEIAQEQIKSGTEEKMNSTVQGYTKFQIQDMSARSRNNTCDYILLPVWTLMAEYKGKRYTYAMNGQTGKVAGRLPTNRAKLGIICGAAFAISYILFVLGGMFL